jgi:DNA-directed RNA polymerase II subunit RPB2
MKANENGIVDNVLIITTKEGYRTKVRIRNVAPASGRQVCVSSRTKGNGWNDLSMPFTDRYRSDIIVNPHAIPLE